ncbi:MAG: helix-turn-helix transcriptional regulator [Bryobacteraceae bacterium]
MSTQVTLGEFEQLVLLAILRLGDNAYGVTIRHEITKRTNREATPGALYTTLDRLEDKGMLRSTMGDPTPERGGRAKRYFEVTGAGMKAITQSQKNYQQMRKGLRLPGLSNA